MILSGCMMISVNNISVKTNYTTPKFLSNEKDSFPGSDHFFAVR
jgi:hypothetical protein